ncbi:MAG: hypothetical protein JW759_00865 [Candidatus Coatesbacteria bacterium]|nr:hypothetical protein [Candidatus Coatesbacteria bacterium]
MDEKGIDKIAQTIAAKLAEPGGNQLLGCGSASSTQQHQCYTYNCSGTSYECGGAGLFQCGTFRCYTDFTCRDYHDEFTCASSTYFTCSGSFTGY